MTQVSQPSISVILPAHNPDLGILSEILEALMAQTLPRQNWELLLVDNNSDREIPHDLCTSVGCRVVRESKLGLTHARRRGMEEARGSVYVFVDDDNLLSPDYLRRALRFLAENPEVGAVGGKSVPRFAVEPQAWIQEFYPLLALRDCGSEILIAEGFSTHPPEKRAYPDFSPIGAGMVLRATSAQAWIGSLTNDLPDRVGSTLTSGGDNDIVLTLMNSGWSVAYDPELSLTHLIPAFRLEPDYLRSLNRGIQESWMKVLTKHGCNPWPKISRFSAIIRCWKAWFTYRAWRDPASAIRWHGACGHFNGRIAA